MPTIKKLVEVEVDHDDVLDTLQKHADEQDMKGVFLVNADGAKAAEVRKGDFLQPRPEVAAGMNIAEETGVLILDLVPSGGLAFGNFVAKDGRVQYQFFNGTAFAGKLQSAPKPAAKAAAAGRKTPAGRKAARRS